MKVRVGYPTHHEEMEVVRRMGVRQPSATRVIDVADLVRLHPGTDAVVVGAGMADYPLRLVACHPGDGRSPLGRARPYIAYGASRVAASVVAAGRALALLRGRDHLARQFRRTGGAAPEKRHAPDSPRSGE